MDNKLQTYAFNAPTPELLEKLDDWLGDDGKTHFAKEYRKHGDLIHLHLFGGGMDVRNFFRSTGLCENWTAHEFDDNWIGAVTTVLAKHELIRVTDNG